MLSARSFGSEIERDRGKQRTRDAMLANARLGHVTGGVVYGYRNAPVYLAGDSSGNPIRSHVRRNIQAEEAAVI